MFLKAEPLLNKILVEHQEHIRVGQTPLSVFDLDSTIFNVSHRTQNILQDFARKEDIQRRFPKEAEILAGIQTQSEDWGIKDCLSRSGIRSTVDFFFQIRDFWVEHFFSNHYLEFDQPYPGSVEFVQRLHEQGSRVEYLTGRDRPRMGEGTAKVLKKWNLPLEGPNSSRLKMKPHQGLSDADFKVDQLKQLKNQYPLVYFFENEPVIIEKVEQHCPEVKVVFIDSVHSRRADPPLHLPRISLK